MTKNGTAEKRDGFLAFSKWARRAIEKPLAPQDARQFMVRTYLRRVAELQESVALSLALKRYATAWALLRPLQESALYGMYVAELASETEVALILANVALRKPVKLPMKPKAIAGEISKKIKTLRGLENITDKWWEILCDNTHGNPSALPLSLMEVSAPVDPKLKEMIILHTVGPTVAFLGIAEGHNVFDKKTDEHARALFFGKRLQEEISKSDT